MLALYRSLIALRRAAADLTDPAFGSLAAEADEEARLFRLTRGDTQIVVNFSGETRRMPMPGSATVLLSTHDGFTLDAQHAVLPARSAAVLRLS